MTRRCACCDKPFEPRPQVADQAFCSSPRCQRARKRRWQRTKLQTDPDYRINQQAAQQAWSQRNQGYWRNYRTARPLYKQCNRELQRTRDDRKRNITRQTNLAKMDVCTLPSGLYRITRPPAFSSKNGNSWIVKITPVRLKPPRKMDVSREDLIDARSFRP